MADTNIHEQINELIAQEKELRNTTGDDAAKREQLRGIEATLDQCWDLLRQRDARREFGQDPSEAHVRPQSEVEGYLS